MEDTEEINMEKINIEEINMSPIVENIVSHDCKKSIPLVNSSGQVVLPHFLTEDFNELRTIVSHCNENMTLLRYFDLEEVIKFILYINTKNNTFVPEKYKIDNYFDTISEITMMSLKSYYLCLLNNLFSGTWGAISMTFKTQRKQKIEFNSSIDVKGNRISKMTSLDSKIQRETTQEKETQPNNTIGVYVTTKDAYTLTDGPTIYLCEDVQKIGTFCIQQANIPTSIMKDLLQKIEYNNNINEKIFIKENDLEHKQEQMEKASCGNNDENKKKSKSKDSKKMTREMNNTDGKSEISKLTNELNMLRSMIKSAVLNDTFIPNKLHHIEKWEPKINTNNAFSSNIDESVVAEIRALQDINDNWKILLLMGIGVFMNHRSIKYREIMKTLADEQKLYMIIASSDYIYGTNYQFCHAYIGKDMNLTQEKIIQSMGRVGRGNIQQSYTVRFRNNEQICKLFHKDVDKPEVQNMNKLFSNE